MVVTCLNCGGDVPYNPPLCFDCMTGTLAGRIKLRDWIQSYYPDFPKIINELNTEIAKLS